MTDHKLRLLAACGLVTGGVLGIAGCFMPVDAHRGLAWGIDGVGLVMAAAVLTMHYSRRGNDLAAAGFLTFCVGETLILAGAAMSLMTSVPTYGAGVSLWAAGLVMVSLAGVFPRWLCALGCLAAVLLAVVSVRIFFGEALSPLARPLPFLAYPPFAATLFGWAWCLATHPARAHGHAGS